VGQDKDGQPQPCLLRSYSATLPSQGYTVFENNSPKEKLLLAVFDIVSHKSVVNVSNNFISYNILVLPLRVVSNAFNMLMRTVYTAAKTESIYNRLVLDEVKGYSESIRTQLQSSYNFIVNFRCHLKWNFIQHFRRQNASRGRTGLPWYVYCTHFWV